MEYIKILKDKLEFSYELKVYIREYTNYPYDIFMPVCESSINYDNLYILRKDIKSKKTKTNVSVSSDFYYNEDVSDDDGLDKISLYIKFDSNASMLKWKLKNGY